MQLNIKNKFKKVISRSKYLLYTTKRVCVPGLVRLRSVFTSDALLRLQHHTTKTCLMAEGSCVYDDRGQIRYKCYWEY